MKIKLLLISFILAANALGAVAQVSKTYFVSKPGTLISMMTEDEANSITHLTLTGKINAEDFRHLRDEFPNLKVLDIFRTQKSRCTAEKPVLIPMENSTFICRTSSLLTLSRTS